MAITPNFSLSQVWGASNEIVIADTSTGSDVSISARRVYLEDNVGNFLVETGTTTDYEEWEYAEDSITLDVLTQDMALNVTVEWVDSIGDILYTKTVLTHFPLYAKTYYSFLIKAQSSNTRLIDTGNFFANFIKLCSLIKAANDSIEDISDISSSQAALNRAKKLIDNPSNFF